MLPASDSKFSKTTIGNFTFDIERERTRQPLFLHRNIIRVLDHHAKSRSQTMGSSIESRGTAARRQAPGFDPGPNPVTPPPRSSRLRDQLIEKFHRDDAELILDIRSIRRKLNYRENLAERPSKRLKHESVSCKCYLAVWDNREGHRQLEPILKRSEDCTVASADPASGAHVVEIELQNPFRVPVRDFFVPLTDRNGQVSKWAVGDRYLLEIKIIPCTRSKLWPPIPLLSRSEESLTRDIVKRTDLAFSEGMLISNYTNLPHAPPTGVPLSVSFDQAGRTFKTKFGIEVHAEWTYPHLYDAKLKKEATSRAEQMKEEEKIDPLCRSINRGVSSDTGKTAGLIAADVTLPVKQTVTVYYIWDVEPRTTVPHKPRSMSLEGLNCPVCHVREFSNVERLQFHFCNVHDKYRLWLESQKHYPDSKVLKSVVFRVEPADIVRPRAANYVKDEREFSWQRPPRSFDIEAYVSGDQSWVGAIPRRRNAAAATAAIATTTTTTQTQQLQASTGAITSSSTSATVVVRKGKFQPAAEVPEVLHPVRTKFRVPVPRTRRKTSFYRSVSHRAAEEGELLSETDNDIDADWLMKRHHDTFTEADDLSQSQKTFRQKWNTHILSEGCPCPRYISDSLVRFVRANATWLQGHIHSRGGDDTDLDLDLDMFTQYYHLTAVLRKRRLVDARVLRDCLQIIQGETKKMKEEV